jgi:putative Holliday junction resolvase
VETDTLMGELEAYVKAEHPEVIVVGDPGEGTDSSALVQGWTQKLRAKWPNIDVVLVDEIGTSNEASQALVMGGMKKSKRREKGALDKVAAALILERYLAQR